MTPGLHPGSVFSMERPKILPLPGNSDREGNFYEQQRSSGPADVSPTGAAIDQEQPFRSPFPTAPDPSPFKITGGK